MSIEYTYEIVAVDQEARCMEVVYTSPGHQTMHIGARLPYAGETLEAVVQMYAPVAYWMEQAAQVQSIAVGASGKVGGAPITLESAKASKLAEIAAWRYQRESSGITVNGTHLPTDRESRAQMLVTYTGMSDIVGEKIRWKTGHESWAFIDKPEMFKIICATNAHVQKVFGDEKTLAEQVLNAKTIADVDSITLP